MCSLSSTVVVAASRTALGLRLPLGINGLKKSMSPIAVLLLLASLAATARGGVLLSSLNQTIEVYYAIDGVPVTNGG